MAFNWLKKIVNAPIKVVKTVVNTTKVVVQTTGRIVKPKGADVMSDPSKLEKAIREVVATIIASRKKSGVELAIALVPMMLDLKSIMDGIKDVPETEWIPNLKIALDNLIGEEEDALIGPRETALLKVDIPYIGLEAVSDLILQAAENAMLLKAAEKAATLAAENAAVNPS